MSCFSVPTTIHDISVVHCRFTPGDEREEHYCVDINGFTALQLHLNEGVENHDLTEPLPPLFYGKIQIFYNDNLDGDDYDRAGTNPVNCKAASVLP